MLPKIHIRYFYMDNQKDCHSEHEQTLVPLQQELKEDVNFVSSAKWVRNGLLEGQLRDRLFGGMFCLPWRKSVSLLGEACSLKDTRSHGQREEHLSTHGNRQLVPVTATRTQWERPMWLPFRSWTGIKMEDQWEGRLDALQEERDSHTKDREQQKRWLFSNGIPQSRC